EVLYPPIGLAATVDQDEVTLAWQLPSTQGGLTRDLLGYRVYRDGIEIADIGDPSTLAYLDVDLANGGYDYEVSALYTTGESQMSNLVSVTVEVLYPPIGLAATVDQDEVTLAWQLPSTQGGLTRDLLGYRVYRDGIEIADIGDPSTLAYLDVDLANGGYDYEVSALYTTGESQMSNLVSVTVEVLYPPIGLAATVDQDEVTLAWQLPSTQGGLTRDLLGYRVYRDGIEIADIGDPSTLAYLDVDLANGGYDYEVSALYTTGESQMSNLVSVTVEVLYPPIGLAATVDQDEVTLAWQLPSTQGGLTRDLLGYRVYRDGIEIADIGDPSTLAYLDVDLANGGYDYEVSALYTTGESQMSNLVSVTVEVLYPPQNLTAVVTNDVDVNLNWDAPLTGSRSLNGYLVYRDASLAATISDPAQLTWSDINLPNGTYDYSVKAFYTTGISPASNIAQAVIDYNPVLDAPTGLSAVIVNGNDVDLSWTAPASTQSGYKVYRDGVEIAELFDPYTTTYTDTGLPNGVYGYTVTAIYYEGESAPSNTAYADIMVTSPPQNLAAQVQNGNDAVLNWSAPANAGCTGYLVYRNDAEIAVVDTSTVSYNDVGLANGAFDYYVKALFGINISQASNTASVVVEVLYPPTGLTADVVNDNDVYLTWAMPINGRDLFGYKVYRDGALIQDVAGAGVLEYTDISLPNGSYSYTVSASYSSGESAQTDPATALISVDYPPQNLTAQVQDDNDVVLNWDAPQTGRNLLGYKVYRDGIEIADITDPATLDYLDSGLANGDYDYCVTALYSSGESAPSNSQSVTIEVLYAPQNLTAQVQNGDDVVLNWDAPQTGRDHLGYKVYRDGIEIADITDPSTLTYLDTGLANGGYDYHVTALYSSGESAPSNTQSVTIEVLYAPQNLTAQVQDGDDVLLNWDAPQTGRDHLGYKVYRDGIEIADITDPSTLTYLDTGLANGGYDYHVTALYSSGESAPSNTQSVTIEVLYAPQNLTAQVQDGDDVLLNWDAPQTGRDHLGYKVYRDGIEIADITDPATLAYLDSGLANGDYDYHVTALYSSGESAPSNSQNVSIEVLYPPQNLSAQVQDGDDVLLNWDAPQTGRDLLGYKVYRDGIEIADITDPATLDYLDAGLANGDYDYHVTALYSSGESVPSNTQSVTIEVLYAPQNLIAQVQNGDDVLLNWDAPQTGRDLLGYKVYRDGTEIADITDPAMLAYLDTGLANGNYDYEVSALYTSGESPMSNLATVNLEVPYAPTGLTATVVIDDVTLNWNIPPTQERTRDLTGYKLYRDGTLITTIDNPTVTTYADNDLVNGSYSYEVSATYSSGDSPMSAPAVAVVAVVTPPENPAYTVVNGNDVYLTWELPINQTIPDYYTVYRDGGSVHVTASGVVLDWTDTGLENGDYDYWLTATYTAGESAPTTTMSVQIAVMNPPTGLVATVTLDLVQLTWIEPAGASGLLGYIVYRDGTEIFQIDDPTTLEYDDADLAAGDYQYHVTALFTVGESVPSNQVNVSVLLLPPDNVSAVATDSDVLISWDTPTIRSLTGFRVHRDGSVIAELTDPGQVEYTDTNLPNGDYSYTVQSLFTSGESAQSTPANCTVEALWPPQNLAAAVNNDNDVTLSWDAHPMGITMIGWKVYRNDVEIAQIGDPEVTTYD
ncbi:MAG: hypothetical protein K8R90_01605, partial [Candidatus Cloacimonetes bacterium]|nr:hypothetical protein [Candidatus Cloacimonadota bacterium]